MTVAIGYVRVSTEEQATEGVSIEAQSGKLRQYAALYDIDLVDIVVDAGVSGETLKRDGLQRALAALKAGEATALLIAKLDRLTRSVVNLGQLIDEYFQEHQLLSVVDHIDTGTANGRFLLNILASVAQWQREAIVEQTVTSLGYMKAQRRTYNHVPLGFRDCDGLLVEVDEEQLIVAEVLEMRDSGASLHAVARDLNERGIIGKRGGRYYASTIRAICQNPIHQAA